jgi:hypothetical protein
MLALDYAPRMLRFLDFEAATIARPLLNAVTAIATRYALPATNEFLHLHFKCADSCGRRATMMRGSGSAVMFHLRDALRANDTWLEHSHRYGDLRHVLVPMAVAHAAKLTISSVRRSGSDRKARLLATCTDRLIASAARRL